MKPTRFAVIPKKYSEKIATFQHLGKDVRGITIEIPIQNHSSQCWTR